MFSDAIRKFGIPFDEIPRILEEAIYRSGFNIGKERINQFEGILEQLDFDVENGGKRIFEYLTLFLLEIPDKVLHYKKDERAPIIFFIENVILSYLTTSNANESIIINYEDIEQNLLKKWSKD